MHRRLVVLALTGLLAGRVAAATRTELDLLRRAFAAGGTALLARHAQTEAGIGDPPGYRLDDCRTQRNLSAAGRTQAQRLGATLEQAALRIDEVRSSRWCRCVETAQLAFPTHEVQPLAALDSFFDDRERSGTQTAALREYLSALGPRNAALVTHQVNIAALTGTPVAMGEALAVRAAAGAVQVVGRFGPY